MNVFYLWFGYFRVYYHHYYYVVYYYYFEYQLLFCNDFRD